MQAEWWWGGRIGGASFFGVTRKTDCMEQRFETQTRGSRPCWSAVGVISLGWVLLVFAWSATIFL